MSAFWREETRSDPMSSKRPPIHGTHDSGERPQDREHDPTHAAQRSTTETPLDSSRSTSHEIRSSTHADALALALDQKASEHAGDPGRFAHEKLDVYRIALEMAALAKDLAEEIPRGHRSVADHLLRAASNTVLLCAEGANRRGAALKRQRFVESRGEVGEVAAAGDLILVLNIGTAARAIKMKRLASRVSAMLTRLIARHEKQG